MAGKERPKEGDYGAEGVKPNDYVMSDKEIEELRKACLLLYKARDTPETRQLVQEKYGITVQGARRLGRIFLYTELVRAETAGLAERVAYLEGISTEDDKLRGLVARALGFSKDENGEAIPPIFARASELKEIEKRLKRLEGGYKGVQKEAGEVTDKEKRIGDKKEIEELRREVEELKRENESRLTKDDVKRFISEGAASKESLRNLIEALRGILGSDGLDNLHED